MSATLSSTLCAAPSCGSGACASLQGQDLCRPHFIARCYQDLEECGRQLEQNEHWNSVCGEPLAETLIEIVDQAAALGLTSTDLDGLEQAQLLDILFTAGHLMKNLRRGLRKSVSIPLKLCYEVTGHNWTEETTTQELSLHGASMECRIPVATGELVTVERTDVHRRTRAKVKWHRRRINGSQTIGIELLESSDFWGFNQG